ncbi:hypothetical protein CB1_000813010 [Camelus ferus]|nr:hypothetical protein CB1_000813010 [Camelus ferus]
MGRISTDTSSLRKADPKGRSALLADIQQGTRLRKVTQINDRSAPQIESANSSETPPPLPPKSPSFQAQPPKPSVQVPPAPPGSQTFLQKKRPGRGAGTSGGKLNPPPAPPARSPTTELSSRSQQAPAWTPTQQPGGQLRNGSLHIMDDFESKFTFHSMEDFPPPDEYKPCQKIYPSKIPRSTMLAPETMRYKKQGPYHRAVTVHIPEIEVGEINLFTMESPND